MPKNGHWDKYLFQTNPLQPPFNCCTVTPSSLSLAKPVTKISSSLFIDVTSPIDDPDWASLTPKAGLRMYAHPGQKSGKTLLGISSWVTALEKKDQFHLYTMKCKVIYHLLMMLDWWLDLLGLQGGIFLMTLGHSITLWLIPSLYLFFNSVKSVCQKRDTSSSIFKTNLAWLKYLVFRVTF